MSAFRSWYWIAMAFAVGLTASTARAGMITPDSIPSPPSAVGSASGTAVDVSHLVTNQYVGLGLNFDRFAAISHLNGISVWVPIVTAGLGGPPQIPLQTVYYGGSNAVFVSPGTLKPTTVSSFSVAIVGNQPLSMSAYDTNGLPLQIAPVIASLADSQVWTFTGPGISSFSVRSTTANSSPWGISGISFTTITTASTPEPSSLMLAGLGVMGMVARLGWRRARIVA